MNDDVSPGIFALLYADPHFFTPDNYIDAPEKPTIYLRFTALV